MAVGISGGGNQSTTTWRKPENRGKTGVPGEKQPTCCKSLTNCKHIVLVSTLCDNIFQSLAAGWWVSPNNPISSNNETYCRDILVTEVKLKLE